MKQQFIPFLLFVCVLASCKKDSPADSNNNNEIRLTNATSTDATGNVATTSFKYDDRGRIVAYDYSYNHGTVKAATVTYSGDKMTITYATQKPSYGTYNSAVRYTLNADHMPVQRVEYNFFQTTDNNQVIVETDSLNYEYDALGMLKKATGDYLDSSWFGGASPGINADRSHYTCLFTNTANTLTQLSVNAAWTFKDIDQSGEHNDSGNDSETFTFGYTKKYPNKADSLNAALFAEWGVIYDKGFPLGKAYAYLPDNAATASGYMGFYFMPFFFLKKLQDLTPTTTVEYDKDGRISSMTTKNKTNFIYSN